jgi:DNA primase
MGKTYIDTVKYLVKASLEVDGIVEKPDIVGAIFGQTEGLLGDELDLRELQKNGRIGRIEVDFQTRGNKCSGFILLPSSLDMAETSILAAALEIVDRIGPCEAKIKCQKIEDTRNLKRKQVLDRAKELLRSMLMEEIPESKELTELVREDVKVADVVFYGEDKLPAGPAVTESENVVVVEGRADVVNLLKNGLKNVVAIGGAKMSRTIARIGREKEITVFLDGDRGGDIILKELKSVTDVDFVARAPPGKEVEELTRKEIIKSLRRRVPVEQTDGNQREGGRTVPDLDLPDTNYYDREKHESFSEGPAPKQRDFQAQPSFLQRGVEQVENSSNNKVEVQDLKFPGQDDGNEGNQFQNQQQSQQQGQSTASGSLDQQEPSGVDEAALKSVLKQMEGSLKAKFLDSSMNAVSEVPIREIMRTLGEAQGIFAVALDGVVTQRLVELAEQKGVKYVVGIRSGAISRKPPNVRIVLAA